jgi:hypothetical protein
MKNVYEVLRPELEVARLEEKVAALRVAAPLLSEDGEAGNGNQPRLATSTANGTPHADRAVGWDDRAAGRSRPPVFRAILVVMT